MATTVYEREICCAELYVFGRCYVSSSKREDVSTQKYKNIYTKCKSCVKKSAKIIMHC